MVDGLVDHVGERFSAEQTVVLTNAVEDDDSVIHGITHQGEERRDDRQGNLETQQREESQRNQHIMKHGQNGGSPVDPFESEGNIYQHAPERIESNVDGLLAQLGADFRTDDFNVANGKRTERKTRPDGVENGRCHTGDFGEIIGIGEDAVGVRVPIIENILGQLLIAVARVDPQKQRILLGKHSGERSGRSGIGIEIRLFGGGYAISGVQSVEHLGPARLHKIFVLPLAFDKNEDFVVVRIGDVVDALDFRVAKPLGGKTAAKFVKVGGFGKTNVHVSAATKIDSVLNTASEENRNPSDEKKNTAQGVEVLGLAHPIEIGLLEELEHAFLASLS